MNPDRARRHGPPPPWLRDDRTTALVLGRIQGHLRLAETPLGAAAQELMDLLQYAATRDQRHRNLQEFLFRVWNDRRADEHYG